ncbi:MAG: GGDEF domain-containing protein [Pseudomonadota bacterium]
MELDQSVDPQHDFDASLFVARKVLYTAASMRLPLNPKVFRVLYEAECGPYETLKRLSDEMRTADDGPDVVEIEDLHDKVFDGTASYRGLSDISERLMTEMEQVGDIVADRIGHDANYIGTLTEARRNFGLFTRAADAKRLISDLVSEAQMQAARVSEFMAQIEAKQAQIGELKGELSELRERVNLDHLTGLFNRRYLDDALAREVQRSKMENAPLSLAICDLDHFKKLNDTWGHSVGDSVLKHFAGIMRSNTKGKDIVARYGGEEFALIFPDTNARDARKLLETIRQALYTRNLVSTTTRKRIGHVSASFGLAGLRPDDTVESIIGRADELLYVAKNRGRNNIAADFAQMSGAAQAVVE